MLEPWTQRLRVSWRTSLAFYENRLVPLKGFESEGLLRQVRVEENRVSVRLGDPAHLLVYEPDLIEVASLQPTGDLARLETAITRVWEELAPTRVARPSMSFQWLVPLEQTYDEAREKGIETVFGVESGDVTFQDWSAILTGRAEDPTSTWSCEFGIVSADEAPRRLGRMVGSFRGQSPDTPITIWPPDSLPPVAFFLDLIWVTEGPIEGTPKSVVSNWHETRRRGSAVVSEVMKSTLGVETE